MIYGLWFMVYGLWFTVYDLWFMVYGAWFIVYSLGSIPRHRPSAFQPVPQICRELCLEFETW